MKILIITGIFPPEIGGPATYSDLLLREFVVRGFDIKILTYSYVKQKFPIFYVSKKWPKGLRHIIFLAKLFFLATKSDLILSADASFGAGFMAALVSRLLCKKFIVRVTGDYAWEQGVARFGVKDLLDDFLPLQFHQNYSLAVRCLAKLQSWTVCSADKIIAPSEYLKKIILRWGVSESKIKVISNGIVLPQVSELREELRGIFSFKGLTILSVGRLVPWKGFAALMDVFSDLLSTISGAQLIIIGDGPERAALELQISNSKLSIKILNKMPQAELFKYIKASDVFVLNTAYEGFSHQLVEVMDLGVPIITTNVGGNSEIITSGENGILVPYNDKEKLKTSLLKLLGDETLRNKLATAGLVTAQKFTDEKMISELIKVINIL